MKKETIRRAFEKQQKAFGKDRYGGYDSSKVKTDFEELKEIRNNEESKTWKQIKNVFLVAAFALIIFMLLKLLFELGN